jgi:hypothetical protein
MKGKMTSTKSRWGTAGIWRLTLVSTPNLSSNLCSFFSTAVILFQKLLFYESTFRHEFTDWC